MKKEPNLLDKIEKAIIDKYGPETVQSLKANWTPTKELGYLKQLKKTSSKQTQHSSSDDKVMVDGVYVPKKLFIKETDRVCTSCGVYSFDNRDDLYMTKFRCCFKCWIQNIQGREYKWERLTENE